MPAASSTTTDCTIIGASFAGLACAYALARNGLRVTVLEKKADAGAKLHTTGIIVKEAIEQIPLLDALPAELTRRVRGVRLYAPNMRHVDLTAPGYYFLATDTPAVLRWLAEQAERAGAKIAYRTALRDALRIQSGFSLGELGTTRYLIGADGPKSHVASTLGLGRNRQFLVGVEHEFADVEFPDSDRLHCFVDRKLAPGYIGWAVSGVGVLQVGLARRDRGDSWQPAAAMAALLEKLAPVCDLRQRKPVAVRAGLIPCGGVVQPVAGPRVLLVGDAAGMVSPLTAGGIHTALKHGLAAGHAIADYLNGKSGDPCDRFVHSYPTFRLKRWLRFAFDHFQSDLLFNLMLSTRPMRAAASVVYFHHKGVFTQNADQAEAAVGAAPSKGQSQ